MGVPMNFVTRLRVCNDADNVSGRVVNVVPGNFCVLLSPGEECIVTAVGSDAVPALTVVESASGMTIICEGEAAVTVEGPRTYDEFRGVTETTQEAEPDAAPDPAA